MARAGSISYVAVALLAAELLGNWLCLPVRRMAYV